MSEGENRVVAGCRSHGVAWAMFGSGGGGERKVYGHVIVLFSVGFGVVVGIMAVVTPVEYHGTPAVERQMCPVDVSPRRWRLRDGWSGDQGRCWVLGAAPGEALRWCWWT